MATPTRTQRVHVSLRLTPEQHARLTARATSESRSLTQHLIELVKEDARRAPELEHHHNAPATLHTSGGTTEDRTLDAQAR